MKKVIVILPLFTLLLVGIACNDPSERQNAFTNFTNEAYNSPIPYVSLEELRASINLSELFPQFDITEVIIDSKTYYKFSLKDSNIYVLIDEGQTSLTIHHEEKTMSFPITNIFPTATYSPAVLIVENITDSQDGELIYISSGGGTGALYSTCHIVDLSTLTEYPINRDFRSAITSNIKIVPQKVMDEDALLCEVALEDQQEVFGTIPITKRMKLEQYRLVPADSSSYTLMEWDPDDKSIEVCVGLTLTDAVPGNYICMARGKLIFDRPSQSFVGEPCYNITIANPV